MSFVRKNSKAGFRVSALAMMGVLGLGASTGAQAAAYAVSINSISNFGITFSSPTTLNSFTFTGDSAAINAGVAANGALHNAAPACINCSYNDSFTAHGMPASSYAYGDTVILNSSVTASTGAAKAIGEAYLTAPTLGLGYGQGINTMTANFLLGSTTTLTFDFLSDPYLKAVLTSGPYWASADMAMNITIRNSVGTVFRWTPDGATGGISGGSELADPFSLNTGLPQLAAGTSLNDEAEGHFRAVTTLTSGLYTLDISMVNTAQVNTVPVPAAAWLLGSGLIGLAGLARRSRKA